MSGFSGSRVLVTGGLGFIGSNLAIRLVELGAAVTLVDSLVPEYGGNPFNIEPVRDRVHVNISDVRDEHAMRHLVRGQDLLFNLAGQTSHLDSMSDPLTDLAINARAQLSILEACRRHNPAVRIVFASTRQLYGRPVRLPVGEDHPPCPVDVNGINKLAGEQYHLLYHHVHGIRAVALRLTNTYGPRMRVKDARQTFLGIWIRRLIDGEPLLVYGDGTQIRDFNYVDDVVDGMLRAAASTDAWGQVVNLGAPDPIDLRQAAATMVQAFGAGSYELVPFPADRKSIDIGDYYADYRKATRLFGFAPEVSFREGIARTLSYYREHAAHYWDRPMQSGGV